MGKDVVPECGLRVAVFRRLPKITNATISFVMPVRLSIWKKSVSTGRIFMITGI
jgi:hypothetical protein